MKNQSKNTKTKKLLISVMSTAALLAACSPDAAEETNKATYSYENDDDVEVGSSWEEDVEEFEEIELEHLQDRYPGIDLDAMEDYFEEEGIEYDEEELIAALDEYEETGSVSDTSGYSAFPWYMFMLANSGSKTKSGVVTTPKVTTPKTNVTTPKTTTKQNAVTTTPKTSTNTNTNKTQTKVQSSTNSTTSSSSSVSTGSASKSGFGGSSTSTGS